MAPPRKYPQELRDRAVRLARESDRPLAHVARDLGVHPEALRNWVRQDEADRGPRGPVVHGRAGRAQAAAGRER
jgi:transposase